jgi:AcrR family transcriptional regulator
MAMNLRERKKLRTRETISTTAIDLFLEHGFDQVSITQIAEAAEVSRRTLFAYFPTKEDLVMYRIADHETEAGRAVRESTKSPLTALREQYLDALARRDPITGLCDDAGPKAFYDLLLGTPALHNRWFLFIQAAERDLADALREKVGVPELVASFAAAQIMSMRWLMTQDNHDAIAAGMSADARYPAAVNAAELAFELLGGGLTAAGVG